MIMRCRRGLLMSIILFGFCGILILRQFQFGGRLHGSSFQVVTSNYDTVSRHHTQYAKDYYPTFSILNNHKNANVSLPILVQNTVTNYVATKFISNKNTETDSSFLLPSNINESAWMEDALIIQEITTTTTKTKTINDDSSNNGNDDHYLFFQNNDNNNCSITRQVKIIVPRCDTTTNNNNDSFWILQTLDANGQPKNIGGDEFYVTYYEKNDNGSVDNHPIAVAEVTDNHDGTYTLHFLETPPSLLLYHYQNNNNNKTDVVGTLTVVFQYTCGVGQLAPPIKNTWKSGGATVASYSIQTPSIIIPPITPFSEWRRSSSISSTPNNNKTVFFDDLLQSSSTSISSSSALDIVAVGDSMMEQFVKPLYLRIPNIGRPLNTTTLPEWKDIVRQRLDDYSSSSSSLLSSTKNNTNTTIVLLMSSHAWDLLEQDNIGGFADHETALRDLLTFIQTNYNDDDDDDDDSPKVKIFWKSPTALHVHIPLLKLLAEQQQETSSSASTTKKKQQQHKQHKQQQQLIHRLRYMSASRSYELYQRQKYIITHEFLNVSFLDVYRASHVAAHATFQGDGRHYQPNWNTMTVNWFMKTSLVEQVWKTKARKKKNKMTMEMASENALQQQQQQHKQPLVVIDCKSSVMNIVNGILLATASNLLIDWKDGGGEDCTLPKTIASSLPEKVTQQGRKAEVATTSRTITHHDHHNMSQVQLPESKKLLSLEEVRTLGNLKAGPDLRFTNVLYSEGEDYLLGMILFQDVLGGGAHSSQLLSKHQVDDTLLRLRPEVIQGGAAESIVIAMDHDAVVSPDDESSCLGALLQNRTKNHRHPSTRISCHILILTSGEQEEALMFEDDDVFSKKWNCNPVRLVVSKEEETKKTDSFRTTVSYLAMIAKLDVVDAFVTRCDDDDDDMAWKRGLLRYFQSEVARSKGTLPVAGAISTIHCCP